MNLEKLNTKTQSREDTKIGKGQDAQDNFSGLIFYPCITALNLLAVVIYLAYLAHPVLLQSLCLRDFVSLC